MSLSIMPTYSVSNLYGLEFRTVFLLADVMLPNYISGVWQRLISSISALANGVAELFFKVISITGI